MCSTVLARSTPGNIFLTFLPTKPDMLARALRPGGSMVRERALKVVLVLLGLLFVAAVYPVVLFYATQPALAMMLSLYFALGVFLLLAARDPASHRSLIAFTAWSSFAHGAVMAVQWHKKLIPGHEIVGVAVMFTIGLVLLALAPAKQSHASAANA
jgi:hypothetical protein